MHIWTWLEEENSVQKYELIIYSSWSRGMFSDKSEDWKKLLKNDKSLPVNFHFIFYLQKSNNLKNSTREP